jgi:outer membrane protein W
VSTRMAVLASVVALAAASPAFAQDALLIPFSFTAFGGAVFPAGATSDRLSTGFTVGGAVDMRPAAIEPFGFRFDASYSKLGAKRLAGDSASVNGKDLGANLDVVLWFVKAGASGVAPYLATGLSYSQLRRQPGSPEVNITDTEHRFGFNVGAGVDIAVRRAAIRVDARYRRINTERSIYQTIPVTIGLRF